MPTRTQFFKYFLFMIFGFATPFVHANNAMNKVEDYYAFPKKSCRLYQQYTDQEFQRMGSSTLHFAAACGHLDTLQELILEGENINNNDRYGMTPVHRAVSENQVDAVRMLIRLGANIHIFDGNGYNPLHIAANKGYLQIVKLLIENRADVNATSYQKLAFFNPELYSKNYITKEFGFSPLHLAASHGHLEVVQELILKGAKINRAACVIDWHSPIGTLWTPLRYAISNGRSDIAKALIAAGANVHIGPRGDDVPLLHWAVTSSSGVKAVVSTLDLNVNVNAINPMGETALHLAAKLGHVEQANALIKANADFMIENPNGQTPIVLAYEHHQPEMVSLLEEKGARLPPALCQ